MLRPFALLALLTAPLAAQSPLDGYVREGLRANQGLVARRLALASAEAGEREATGRWLPSVTVNARYSERSGNILDLGSLVNPAFRALNQLTGSNQFPTHLRLGQPFKQETSVRLLQPVFNPAVAAGSVIARRVREAEALGVAGEARRLAADIRLAYLDHARAVRLTELHRATLALLDENLRVTEALLANGVATPDALLRARADRSEGVQRLADAERLVEASREAFNLLLERPLETEVLLAPDSALGIALPPERDTALARGLAAREELRQLEAGARVADGQGRLAEAAFLPTVSLAIDYGFQGEDYDFGARQDYLVASLVLQWNLFNGGQDRARRAQAVLAAERLRTERRATARQVELEIRTAWASAEVSRQAVATAQDRLASAERNYGLVERRHREGAASQVELIDARTAFTSARLNLVLTTYDYLARTVEFERAAALYPAQAPEGVE